MSQYNEIAKTVPNQQTYLRYLCSHMQHFSIFRSIAVLQHIEFQYAQDTWLARLIEVEASLFSVAVIIFIL